MSFIRTIREEGKCLKQMGSYGYDSQGNYGFIAETPAYPCDRAPSHWRNMPPLLEIKETEKTVYEANPEPGGFIPSKVRLVSNQQPIAEGARIPNTGANIFDAAPEEIGDRIPARNTLTDEYGNEVNVGEDSPEETDTTTKFKEFMQTTEYKVGVVVVLLLVVYFLRKKFA